MKAQGQRDWRAAIPVLVVFVLWWGSFLHIFAYEWWLNEQYGYGFLVPLLTAYLLSLRWADRPPPSVPTRMAAFWVLPLGGALLLIPLQIILGANPEWRAALWLYAVLCFGASLSLLGLIGGRPWVRHFAVPLGLILLAVPWPTQLEQPVVQGLMRGVAAATVEVLNLLGHFADQEGSLIRLSTGLIGVEEACSGVRSFQATLMASYFIGELFRWKLLYRLALVLLGCGVSLLLNLGRTLTLTLVAIRRGAEAMEVMHDPVGHLVSLGSFALLFVLAWFLHRRFRRVTPLARASQRPPTGAWSPLNPIPAAVMAGLFLLQYAIGYLWYERGPPDPRERIVLDLDWSAISGEIERPPIPPNVRAMLRYSDGEQVNFRWRNAFWTGFLFRWDAGRISSHVGVHSPETCLPAAGFRLISRGDPVRWEAGGLPIELSSSVYETADRHYFVFYAVWDTVPSQRVPLSHTWRDRVANAWEGLRINERQSLELVVVGPSSMQAAQASVRRLLAEALRIEDSRAAFGSL